MAAHHEALIFAMVMASAADRNMADEEMRKIGVIVETLPVFADFDEEELADAAAKCAEMLNDEEGMADTLDFIRDTLPKKFRETAYALACDVVASDGEGSQEELRMLELIRHRLDIDRLSAAGIERGAAARHRVLG